MSATPASHARHFLSRLPPWTAVLLSGLGYGLVALWFPLFPHYRQIPLADIRTLAPSLAAAGGYGLLLLLLYGLFGLAYWQARQRPFPLRTLLLSTLLLSLPLLFTYPFNATDVYRYMIHGRMSSHYGTNPFAVPPSQFAADPFLPLAGEWAGETSPYGPLWEITAAGLTAVSGGNLFLGLTLFKGLGLLLHLAATVLIWHLAGGRHPPTGQAPSANHRASFTLLWAWNPALLFTFVANAHNDIFMLFWLLLGSLFYRRQRPTVGFLLLALAPLTKPIGLLPLPFFWLMGWRQLPEGARWRYTAVTLGGSAALALLLFAPFGSPLDLVQRLLREASGVGGFSITALLILLLRATASPETGQWVLPAARGLFLLFALWQGWQVWHGRGAQRPTANIFLAYVLTAFSFRIWYAVWPVPWLLLDSSAQRRRLGLLLPLTAQLSVLIYGHLRVLVLDGSQIAAHLIGVPFTFLLPFLLARWWPIRVGGGAAR